MKKLIKSFTNMFFKDKNGNFVIFQFPNIPIILWLLAVALSYFIPKSILSQSFSAIGNLFLFTWAYLELTQGVNLFRKLLGLSVLVIVISSYFMK